MTVSATARFLVRNMITGKITYLEAINAKPELQEQIDYYIEQQELSIDKSV